MIPAVFELKIWQKEDQSCFFLLLWDDRKKQLTASLDGFADVQHSYQRWRQRYDRFYLPSTKTTIDSGRLNPGSGDPGNDLREAEATFIHRFQRWLGEGETRKIQQRIQDELMRFAQLAAVQKKGTVTPTGIDLFLSCSSVEIARLPWETWELAPENAPFGAVRMIRTAMDRDNGSYPYSSTRQRKTKILTILSKDPNLPLHEQWQALRSLRQIADVEIVTWLPDEDPAVIKTRIARSICDKRGWDVLFFSGHSDETATSGGRFAIAPNVSFSICELEDQLTQAKDHGLRLAIFNSCSGLSIAHALVDLGVQVVAMREPIRHDVAHSFLKYLCQELSRHTNILDAVLIARQQLQAIEKFAFPSAYLLPSFFSPTGTEPYAIEPLGWKYQLRQWLPNKVEAIAFGAVLTLSLIEPVQNFLYQQRLLAQAMYRDWTNQLAPIKTPSAVPPVLMIAIDQESINRATAAMDKFKPAPMDRRYLAKIVNQLSLFQAKTIGIHYVLDTQEDGEEVLVNAIQSAVKTQKTWFVFTTSTYDQWVPRDRIANPSWTLRGDGNFYGWDLELPEDLTCAQNCSFSYLLAISHTLSHQTINNLPQPTIQNRGNFQARVSQFIHKLKPQSDIQRSLPKVNQFFGQQMVDFSIPPNQIYDRMPAWKFLDLSSNADLQERLKQQVVIVTSGGYFDAADASPTPPVMRYWCQSGLYSHDLSPVCNDSITTGEVQAYMLHHLLLHYGVMRIPDWLIVCLVTLLGKDVALILQKQPMEQRHKLLYGLLGATIAIGLIDLQLYISAAILVPWLLPAVVFWACVLAHGKSTPLGNIRVARKIS